MRRMERYAEEPRQPLRCSGRPAGSRGRGRSPAGSPRWFGSFRPPEFLRPPAQANRQQWLPPGRNPQSQRRIQFRRSWMKTRKPNRELCMFHVVGLGWRDTPVISAARGPHPMIGTVRKILVVHLQYFGRVLNHKSKWIDEVGENIVARAVAANAPADGKAMVDHSARAAHHGFKVRHHERNVV